MKKKTVIFLKVITYLVGIGLLIGMFVLFHLSNYTANMYPEFAYLKFPVLIGMYVSTIPFFYALFQTYKLLKFIEEDHAFSIDAVLSLKRIKLCAIAIIFMYFIGMIFLVTQSALHPSIALVGLAIIFVSCVIFYFAEVLQGIFKNAADIKEENDLTV
ncbi:DUF2975 domain-containing protein [Halalkalibacillus sediminis]|uniref:DUF2975 domain-containing protein n=1 Tax=Halalkalibacillus sediminis TaxID=2018042 RepID=A0A2I0QR36_9BACI|nr:DUF2975 domain-containing protein [Halalkalibacillus sediminis]PKR76788.1 DUF2975 domain-containing protein [Halalkalibacillus sediminis]